jgi:hypothetical protein
MKIRVYYEDSGRGDAYDTYTCDRYYTGTGDGQAYVYRNTQCIATYHKDKWVKVVVVG